MYILGLCVSWGTSRICPAWSPSEHQLAPALSPFGGPRPKPRRPEEVVYNPNDSCSHFTQHLFPPKVPQQHTRTISYSTSNIIHTYYTLHLYAHLHLLFDMSCSNIHFFRSSWQAGCPRLLVSDTVCILLGCQDPVFGLLVRSIEWVQLTDQPLYFIADEYTAYSSFTYSVQTKR